MTDHISSSCDRFVEATSNFVDFPWEKQVRSQFSSIWSFWYSSISLQSCFIHYLLRILRLLKLCRRYWLKQFYWIDKEQTSSSMSRFIFHRPVGNTWNFREVELAPSSASVLQLEEVIQDEFELPANIWNYFQIHHGFLILLPIHIDVKIFLSIINYNFYHPMVKHYFFSLIQDIFIYFISFL